MARTHAYVGFCQTGISRVWHRVRSSCDLGKNPRDPTVNGFELIPAFDVQQDTPRMRMSRSSITERDKNNKIVAVAFGRVGCCPLTYLPYA